MRITFFIGSLVSGGAERVISLLANQYRELGWEVDIALLLKNEVNRKQFPLEKSIRIIDLSIEGNSYWKRTVGWIRSVRNYLKETKPACVVSFIGRINALVLTASIGLGIPTLVSERNDPRQDGRGKVMLTYCNLIYRLADAIVFQTEYERSCFSRALKKRSCIIPNPVSVINCNDIEENRFEISTAGRLVPQKNHALLIDSIFLVKDRIPNIRCEIYGDGPLKQDLENRIKSLHLEKYVHLCGNKTDVNRWIAKSCIFVMTSDFEGLSNALIEAMMLGKACITTDYPGASEVIHNGANGVIIPMENSKSVLADKICNIIEDDILRKKLSGKAEEDARRYSLETVTKKWIDTIDDMSLKHIHD